MVRFLHTGDWQLGMSRRYLSGEAQARFAAARLEAVRAIGRLAAGHACDFVVCAGDVFESNALDRQVVARALEEMAAFPVPLYLLPGNHDPLDAASVYRSGAFVRDRPDHVVVLEPSGVHHPVPGVEVRGATWTSKRPLADLVAGVCDTLRPSPEVLRVVVAHGAVDVGAPDPDDPALIGLARVEGAIAEGCLNYLALGDRHSLTCVGATGRVWYAGAPEPTDFDEVDPGKVLFVDLDAQGCRTTALDVGTWRFHKRVWDVGGPDDTEDLLGWLAGLAGKDRAIVRLGLVGTLCLRDATRLEDALATLGDRFASLEVWDADSDLAVLPDDADFGDLELVGFADQTVRDLRVLAASASDDAPAAQGALALLYRLSGQGAGP